MAGHATSLATPSVIASSNLLQRAQGCTEKLLQNAFEDARQIYINTVCLNADNRAWVSDRASMKDVIEAVKLVQDKYDTKRASKAWKWLAQLSQRVNHYGSVLDVMVQHHPEYVALVWGTMKILFVGVENHEESIHQLSKALCRIADCLPRQELKLILYPSPQMQQIVAKLYVRIVQFLVHAMNWYQKGRAKRAMGAIFKPFALDFQEELNEVHELSRSVDEIATAAAQAELRAVHAKVEETNQKLSLALLEIKQLGDLVSFQVDRVFQVATSTQSLSTQIRLNVQSQTTMIKTVQLNQVMSASFMADIPASGQSLGYCSTFARRQPHSVILSQPEIDALRDWSTDGGIPVLIMETRELSYSKILLLNLLQQIQNAGRPIIWALRFTDYTKRALCIEDILRILVLHALEINSEVLASQDFPVTLSSLRAAATQDDWLSILNRALAGLDTIYVVLDPDLLIHASENNNVSTAELLLAIRRHITSTRLKIILSSFGINKGYFTLRSEPETWKAIRTNSEQRQRMARMKKQHLARVRRKRRI